MVIHSELNWEGTKVQLEYHDADSFDNLPRGRCKQAYGVCFAGDKMIIGRRTRNGMWGLIGGSIEKGESIEQAFAREIQEEANMKVLSAAPIGYQKVTAPDHALFYQLRFYARVEPLGKFIEDPAGGIAEIKLIDPEKYKDYFDWGEIGERIIRRAIEIKEKLNSPSP